MKKSYLSPSSGQNRQDSLGLSGLVKSYLSPSLRQLAFPRTSSQNHPIWGVFLKRKAGVECQAELGDRVLGRVFAGNVSRSVY